jgi:glycosyltransferase involved in cell wall biosynthesis
MNKEGAPVIMQQIEPLFWVVIPFFNEQKLIIKTLEALGRQSDMDFTTVLVNNMSTDRSPQMVRAFIKEHPRLSIHLINEKQKGTGAASDTGFRYAIQHGATIVARTDADALPCQDWVRLLKHEFATGARFVGGRLAARTDEPNYRWYDGVITSIFTRIFEPAPRIFYKRPGQRYPLFMVPGLNMAIDAKLYLEVDGFPRSSIDDTDEDLELHLKVSQIIDKSQARLNKQALVYGSVRKAKSMGYLNIILWYWSRKHKPDVIDVR